jgi:hypothetical protein
VSRLWRSRAECPNVAWFDLDARNDRLDEHLLDSIKSSFDIRESAFDAIKTLIYGVKMIALMTIGFIVFPFTDWLEPSSGVIGVTAIIKAGGS